MKNMFYFALLVIFGISAATSSNAQWVRAIMPASHYGAVYSLCSKDNKLFAGIAGGVYLSEDDGAHWQNVNPTPQARDINPSVWSLASNGQYLIEMFGEPKVYISSNDGTSWIESDIPTTSFGSPFVSAASGNTIIVGLGGTYRSTDNGATWSQLGSPGGMLSITMQDSIALATVNYNGIFRSTDYGATWSQVRSFNFNVTSGSAVSLSGNRAFASGGSFLLSSADGGLTWPDSTNLNCNSINSIAFSPSQSEISYVFAGTDSGVFRSSDDGAHWTAVNNGMNSSLVFSLAFNASGTGENALLFAGTGSGIFVSSDYGNTWSVTGSPAQWVFASNDSVLFAASSNGVYEGPNRVMANDYNTSYSTVSYSTDNGESWTQSWSGFLNRRAAINSLAATRDNNNGVHLVAGGVWGDSIRTSMNHSNVFASSDKGSTWTETYVIDSTSGVILNADASTFFMSTNNYMSTPWWYHVYLSSDEGNTWTVSDTPNTYMKAFSSDGNKSYLGGGGMFSSGRGQSWLANYIQVSTDKGTTWTNVAFTLDSVNTSTMTGNSDTLSTIASLFSSGSQLLVGMQAYYFYDSPLVVPFANGGGVYHLVQNGSEWALADSSLLGRSVFGFASSGSFVFAATDSGIFRSSNYGTTWSDISLGMNHIYVSLLFVSSSYLFASTSSGLWRRPLSEVTSVEGNNSAIIPTNYWLSQNYPNPFNPTTMISYQLPFNSHVSLKVYDVLGREVGTLVSERQSAGSHYVRFNAAGLPSGVYFYRLQAGTFTETKKLMILK